MSTAVIVVGFVCGGMTMYVAAMARVLRRRTPCPACGKKALAMKSLTRGTTWPPKDRVPIDESLHRCEACGAEFGRQGSGVFVPKQAWDAGARGEIPKATVVSKPPSSSR